MIEDSLVVEQGPRWLAEVLYQAPRWMLGVLILATGAGGVGLMLRVDRSGIGRDQLLAMVQNVCALSFCGGVTVLLRDVAELPYVLDVGAGVAVGYVLALLVRLGVDHDLGDREISIQP